MGDRCALIIDRSVITCAQLGCLLYKPRSGGLLASTAIALVFPSSLGFVYPRVLLWLLRFYFRGRSQDCAALAPFNLMMERFLHFGAVVLLLLMATKVQTQSTIADALKSQCLDNVMMMTLDSSVVWGNYLQIDALNDTEFITITPEIAAQCGFSLTVDDWGNATFLASVLNCFSKNVEDATFNLSVRIRISPNVDMSTASMYNYSISCNYSTWAAREILCERNYMEVSVRRRVPTLKQGLQDDDWAAAFTEATKAAYRIWKVVFYLPVQKTMTAEEAKESGYGLLTTPSRLVLRSAYNTSESQLQMLDSVPMAVVRATTFYKQKWMVMLVDSAVACPADGVTFTEDMITWRIPYIISPLVTPQAFEPTNISLGINGQKLDPTTIQNRNYSLDVGPAVITAQFPVGALGGYYKSRVRNNNYGIVYRIEPMLEHQWKDDVYDETKYKILHPITTPFMPRPPTVTNDTVPANRLFNVTLDSFLPDVELVNITFGNETLTIPEANQLGYNVQEHRFPNGSKWFTLQVPFESPHVSKEPTSPDTTTYILPLVYGLNIVPQNTPFTYPAVIIASLKDIVPPSVTGYCSLTQFYVTIKLGNLGHNFVIFVGKRQLTPSMASDYGYTENSTYIWMTLPYNCADAVFEVIKSSELRSRLDLTLVDEERHWVSASFSLSCSFPVKLIECLSNGTMPTIAVKVESVPDLNPGSLTLRDPRCTPLQYDSVTAVFRFNVNTCGTTRKFSQNTMIYENEVLMTTSDPQYRFLVTCYYKINDTKVVRFDTKNNLPFVPEPALGQLVVVMTLSVDGSYNEFYTTSDYPVVKYLRAPLYFEVRLLYSSDPQVELFLEDCWATGSADRNSFPKWDVIVDSCENSLDLYKTVFHPVSKTTRVPFPSHLKRFEVKMFSFTKDDAALKGEIYFHCDVVICDANSPSDKLCRGQCIPSKQRQVRSADYDHRRAYVSSGLILLEP
uniref:ZP domain-containing protein n=1 Tax=Lepisosteus oculatus TaxID=7918 RepID=W5NKT6_LEPOC